MVNLTGCGLLGYFLVFFLSFLGGGEGKGGNRGTTKHPKKVVSHNHHNFFLTSVQV